MAYARDLIPAPGAYLLEGLKDVHGSIELDSLRPSWESADVGVAIADLSLDHAPYAASPRTALQRALDDWNELGYSVKLGIELEGYLLQPDGDGGWEKFNNPRSMVYGTGLLGDPSGFHTDVLEAAEASGFLVELSLIHI